MSAQSFPPPPSPPSPPLPPCRSCNGRELELILSLGRTPLANALLTAAQLAEAEPTFPLDLAFCRACSLVQITETVPPEQLFREYFYLSSFSDTMLRHAEELSARLIPERRLEVLPTARHDAECQAAIEADEGLDDIPTL